MGYELTDVEVRVLGALIEKEMATPEYYPLSLNALTNACNQKSNREPVVDFEEGTVANALESLRARKLAIVHTGREIRVPKHAHKAYETLNLGNRELAVLCVLMLRGPQTVGELKERTQRLHAFDDLDAVESCLRRLTDRASDPLAVNLGRQPGWREARWAHLLSGEPRMGAPMGQAPAATQSRDSLVERVEHLEAEVEGLKQELARFRQQFE